MVYSEEELWLIADIAVEKEIYIISDEIYEKLIYDGYRHVSIASVNDKIKDLTIVVNGVSKTHAMTGWRIGYTASNEEIAQIMGSVQSRRYIKSQFNCTKGCISSLERELRIKWLLWSLNL